MRHRRAGRKLSRNTNERKSLFRNLIRSLVMREKIETTVAKAKAIKPLVDKLMTKAKNGTLAARRLAMSYLPDRAAVDKLFNDLAKRSVTRNSGFTRIRRLSARRGDNTTMALIELVDKKQVKKND